MELGRTYAGGVVPKGLYGNTNVVFLSLLDPSNLTMPSGFLSMMASPELANKTIMVTLGGYVRQLQENRNAKGYGDSWTFFNAADDAVNAAQHLAAWKQLYA